MKACAIICEYNPYHSGHKYHMLESVNMVNPDILIGIMTNHFVQRGNIATTDISHRLDVTDFDIVIELPYPYSLEAADKYAEGAINLVKKMKADYLSFGSANGNIEELKKLASMDIDSTKDVSLASSSPTNNGNDILAIAYLKQLANTNIEPVVIKRDNDVSATKLRAMHNDNKDISEYTSLQKYMNNMQLADYYYYIQTLLITLPSSYLNSIFMMDEGMENLFRKKAMECHSYEEFLDACTSKRYTHARINRTLLHLLLQTSKEEAALLETNEPCRLLYANKRGLQYIKEKDIEVISSFKALPEAYANYLLKAEALIHCFDEAKLKEEMTYPRIQKED